MSESSRTDTPAEVEAAWRDGLRALREDRPHDALACLNRVIASGRVNAAIWLGVAMTQQALGDNAGELSALQQALALEPRNLRALIMTGDCHGRTGDGRAAVSYYDAALRLAAAAPPTDPTLRAEVERARRMAERYTREFEDHLTGRLGGPALDRPDARRVRQSLDLLLGKSQVYLQEPKHYYFPGLPQIAWAERDQFPWLDRVEAATDVIRAELKQVLEEDGAFSPYIEAEPNRPMFDDAHGMLGNPAWSAFYLWKGGVPQPENLARCPSVMEALAEAPLCRIPGRTPSVLFSLLRPGAHIQPHHGFTNARYICHLPLIVPDGCAMRVGAETRPWTEGRACVFDDSVEHEAWNRNPSALRVVMIFDIWRPEIGETERELISALLQAVDSYGGAAAPAWEG
ncbi:aspartyl/asparaginyl beta-hydroxylase domain-containing protein [Phenylobacterium sp.]|uniref:aspartyl/asparaginyl beta-hydroxylase domain-containing protein n=1 Tax=Phenylobacterium sp. TaxID=1871053 RepID=UPI0012072700|nr:aspartyl/asparaginyl beta-hydroxylase domain-containing protein [Phenylobacterium sp.]THD58270.1 MAG: aspartyl/asparaginyl beta-hydroxylase domain-containing protein [Phenylobacterium sp.]